MLRKLTLLGRLNFLKRRNSVGSLSSVLEEQTQLGKRISMNYTDWDSVGRFHREEIIFLYLLEWSAGEIVGVYPYL